MNRRFGSVGAALAGLALTSARATLARAQGLPAPGPGNQLPTQDGASLMVPAIILVVAIVGVLVIAVAMVDMRRKRRAEAVMIESQIADALMREPRLQGTVITTLAEVPLMGRSAPTVEVRGEVEYPDLRDVAVRIVRQELLRHHPEARVEDRILVLPRVPSMRV
jgi:hypothetical protein